MELGHWVTGSIGHLGHLSRPGHRVIILTRRETRVFPVFEKMPKMQNLHLKCGYKYSYLLTYLVEYSIRYWTEYSSSKKLDSHTPTHKSTFGVHYRTGSPGQLGLRVAEFPGDWVIGSQNVTQFHVWWPYLITYVETGSGAEEVLRFMCELHLKLRSGNTLVITMCSNCCR